MAINNPGGSPALRLLFNLARHTRHWCLDRFWPTTRDRVIPVVARSHKVIKKEALKIHSKQNWRLRAGSTFTSNAAGVGTAMFSTRIVENFVETRELSNLWGLFASRPVVSESTFEILIFVVEFVIALTVFTITEHYFSEFLRKRNTNK